LAKVYGDFTPHVQAYLANQLGKSAEGLQDLFRMARSSAMADIELNPGPEGIMIINSIQALKQEIQRVFVIVLTQPAGSTRGRAAHHKRWHNAIQSKHTNKDIIAQELELGMIKVRIALNVTGSPVWIQAIGLPECINSPEEYNDLEDWLSLLRMVIDLNRYEDLYTRKVHGGQDQETGNFTRCSPHFVTFPCCTRRDVFYLQSSVFLVTGQSPDYWLGLCPGSAETVRFGAIRKEHLRKPASTPFAMITTQGAPSNMTWPDHHHVRVEAVTEDWWAIIVVPADKTVPYDASYDEAALSNYRHTHRRSRAVQPPDCVKCGAVGTVIRNCCFICASYVKMGVKPEANRLMASRVQKFHGMKSGHSYIETQKCVVFEGDLRQTQETIDQQAAIWMTQPGRFVSAALVLRNTTPGELLFITPHCCELTLRDYAHRPLKPSRINPVFTQVKGVPYIALADAYRGLERSSYRFEGALGLYHTSFAERKVNQCTLTAYVDFIERLELLAANASCVTITASPDRPPIHKGVNISLTPAKGWEYVPPPYVPLNPRAFGWFRLGILYTTAKVKWIINGRDCWAAIKPKLHPGRLTSWNEVTLNPILLSSTVTDIRLHDVERFASWDEYSTTYGADEAFLQHLPCTVYIPRAIDRPRAHLFPVEGGWADAMIIAKGEVQFHGRLTRRTLAHYLASKQVRMPLPPREVSLFSTVVFKEKVTFIRDPNESKNTRGNVLIIMDGVLDHQSSLIYLARFIASKGMQVDVWDPTVAEAAESQGKGVLGAVVHTYGNLGEPSHLMKRSLGRPAWDPQ